MSQIAVYTKLPCVQCTATFRAWIARELNSPSSTARKFLRLMRHTDSGEYLHSHVVRQCRKKAKVAAPDCVDGHRGRHTGRHRY
jgi:hypothetical protein